MTACNNKWCWVTPWFLKQTAWHKGEPHERMGWPEERTEWSRERSMKGWEGLWRGGGRSWERRGRLSPLREWNAWLIRLLAHLQTLAMKYNNNRCFDKLALCFRQTSWLLHWCSYQEPDAPIAIVVLINMCSVLSRRSVPRMQCVNFRKGRLSATLGSTCNIPNTWRT